MKGILLVGFIAQMMVAMIRYEHPELRNLSTKFLIRGLEKLAATYFSDCPGRKNAVYSNFDRVNRYILSQIILES